MNRKSRNKAQKRTKLALRRETLRTLTRAELSGAAGGVTGLCQFTDPGDSDFCDDDGGGGGSLDVCLE